MSNWTALLLTDPSPSLRRLVLQDLLGRSQDDLEMRELEELRADEALPGDLMALQQADGGWGSVQDTAVALMRLGYLGYGPESPNVRHGAAYLFSRQQPDGSWPLPRQREAGEEDEGERAADRRVGYSMIPMQTSKPLRGLAACGYAADSRAEKAYDWLEAQCLPDGAWPTGLAAGGVYGYVAGYRRLPHSRWGCRSNTTGALMCLAHHPERRRSVVARRALDLLLGRETREEYTLGYEVARLVGAEAVHGFTTFYARFDLALLLDLCARMGASLEDLRVRELVRYVRGLQGPFGLWEYHRKPQVSRWLSFDLLRSLSRISELGDEWLSLEPRTPFQPYPKKQKRF